MTPQVRDHPVLEHDWKTFLSVRGVSVPAGVFVPYPVDKQLLIETVAALQPPLVLKALDPSIVHKIEAGAVCVGLPTIAAVLRRGSHVALVHLDAHGLLLITGLLVEEFFPDIESAMNAILGPAGLSWEEFREVGILQGSVRYGKYRERGFSTPSGKYEFVPSRLEDRGVDPFPNYIEPPESPVSRPDLAGNYPLILVTGIRQPVFFHSEGRQVPVLREKWPDPLLEIHPQTAERIGARDGEWVQVASPRGTVRFRAKLTPGVSPTVVAAPHGWWFPERGEADFAWRASNVNVLTSSDPPYDSRAGSVNIRCLLCRVSPA